MSVMFLPASPRRYFTMEARSSGAQRAKVGDASAPSEEKDKDKDKDKEVAL